MTSKEKILIVDDSHAMLFFLSKIFKSEYEVLSKDSAVSALSCMEEGNIPDLIITDINMPELNGFEFVKTLKNNIGFKQIPIIVLSGNQTSNDKINMLKLGVDDYVVKPFHPEELSVRAQRVVSRVKMNSFKETELLA